MPRLEHRCASSPHRDGAARPIPVRLIILAALVALLGAAAAAGDALSPAEELIRRGRYMEARVLLGRIAEEHRGEEIAVRALLRQIDLERDGEIHLRRLEEIYSSTKDARVLFAVGKYRYAVGAYTTAAEDFAGAARGLDGDAELDAKAWEGAARLGAGELDEAIDLLCEVARSSSGAESIRDRARYLGARALAQRDEHRRCIDMTARLAMRPSDFAAPAALLAARSLLALGDREGARFRFGRLIEEYPESAEASAAREEMLAMGAEEVSPKRASGGGFFVQIASFENEQNARRFAAAKRAEGMGAVEIHHETRDGGSFFPVRIGPFAAEEEARTAAANLATQGVPGNVVERPAARDAAGVPAKGD